MDVDHLLVSNFVASVFVVIIDNLGMLFMFYLFGNIRS
jgi:hypothetical protein